MILSKCCGCFTQDQILNSVGNCQFHSLPFMFLCLNKQPQCAYDPLMCYKCLQAHKGHEFQTITKYFTPQFRHILSTGTSLNGHGIQRLSEHLIQDLRKMRAKLNSQIDKIQATVKRQLQVLIQKYPLKKVFGIPDTEINKSNILTILEIFQRQKSHLWVPVAEKYMRTILGEATSMIGNMLDDVDNYLLGQDYQKFNQTEGQKRAEEFVSKYQGRFDPERHHFVWSPQDKNQNVRIHEQGLIAKYVHNSPAKPAVLTTKPFTRSINKIYIKVTKSMKAAVIFDATLIALGVCVPNTAKIFGFKQLIQPSHGAFLIGSNGKTYHSSLQKYIKKPLSFSFGEGDVIAITVDFDAKMVLFSKWGFFQRHFKMELTVKQEEFQNLRPCVMFHGEVGAMVHIVNQNVYKQKQQEQVFDL